MGTDARIVLPSTGNVTIDGKPLANSLLAEYIVTGSAVTSIDFSGLDINTHKSYRIEVIANNATATHSNLYMFINDDTTITNYYFQYVGGNGTTAYASRGNYPTIAWLDASNKLSCIMTLILVNSYPVTAQYTVDNIGSSLRTFSHAICKTSTVANITQLTFTASVASAIGVGSTIRIYRGEV